MAPQAQAIFEISCSRAMTIKGQSAPKPVPLPRHAKRCIIHIGMHKTGSSSIQRSLNGFEDDRFVYAELGERRNHSLSIYSLFASHPERHEAHRNTAAEDIRLYNERVRQDLTRAISATGDRTLVISGESISVLPEEDLPPLRDYFDRHFSELSIIGYVRPPAAFMASSFQQRVKNGRATPLEGGKLYRNYQELFEKFDRVFGRERVQLHKFDPTNFPGGCVVRDFCARIGLQLPSDKILRMNESFSRDAIGAMYTYVKFGAGYGGTNLRGKEAAQIAKVLSGPKFRFSPDFVRPILDQYRSDIEWMEQRLGQRLQEDLGEAHPGDVRNEADLLEPNPTVAARLRDALGGQATTDVDESTPEGIAMLVHLLRQQNAERKRRALPKRLSS
jgi:hypothetical protein